MNKEEPAEPAGSEPVPNAAQVKMIADLQTNVAMLTKLVEGIQTNSASGERAALVSRAAREGKVIPAHALTGDLQLNNAQLGALIKDLAVTVPLEQRTSEVTAPSAQVLQMNSADEQVRKQLGITKDEWDKIGKAA